MCVCVCVCVCVTKYITKFFSVPNFNKAMFI